MLFRSGLGAFSGTDIPLSESPLDIALGDFNTDGKLDIAIGNDADSRTISLALGDGAGSFGGVTNVVTDSSTIIAVADLNNDGVPDLVADGENSTSNPRVVSIRLGGCVATPPHNTCSFSNGGLNPQLSSESGVAAPTGFFWSEVQHNTGNTTEVNNFAGLSSRDGFFRLADDFAIGQPCTLASVVFYAYLNGAPATPSPFTGYTLQIWNGRPGDAGASVIVGDTTTNRLASSVDSTYFRIFNSAVPPPGTATTTANKIWANTVTINTTLTAGTYWLDWSSTVTGGAAHFQPSKTLPGSRGAFNDNARQQTVSTGVWRDALDRGKPSSAPDYIQDFPFDVTGIGGGGTPTPTPTPTPALATVDGRVLTSDGRGLRNATVSMTSSQGVIRTSTTSSFGFFSFDIVRTGEAYMFRVASRLFRYQPQTVQVNGNLTLPDFVGLE